MNDSLTAAGAAAASSASSRPAERDRTRTLSDSRAARGRYLERHHARVIEQDNLFVVEFMDQPPWYTRAAQRRQRREEIAQNGTPLSIWSLAFFSVGASALTLAYLYHLI